MEERMMEETKFHGLPETFRFAASHRRLADAVRDASLIADDDARFTATQAATDALFGYLQKFPRQCECEAGLCDVCHTEPGQFYGYFPGDGLAWFCEDCAAEQPAHVAEEIATAGEHTRFCAHDKVSKAWALRRYIEHCGCDADDTHGIPCCHTCRRPFRRWHVHVMRGQDMYVQCARCADADGAC